MKFHGGILRLLINAMDFTDNEFTDLNTFEAESGIVSFPAEIPDIAHNSEYSEFHSLLADGGDRFGVSAVSFDLQEELLWMGNQGGHITSYYGLDMQKYTSFQIHAINDVRQICSIDSGILALTRDCLRCQSRQGLCIFNHATDSLEEMQCMLLTSPTTLLMGGHQDKLVELDLAQVEETRQVGIGNSGCAILRHHSRFLCCGDTSGKVTLRDPSTLKIEHTLDAHNGTLSDFDVHGNHLVTCGFSNRLGNLTVDRFLMVYDLRVMRAVAPIQVMLDPVLLRFVPAFTSRLVVVSQTGQFQLLEMGALTESAICIYQVNTGGSMCLTFDVSSSCQALSFGDAGGYVHLFTSCDQTTFNPYSRPTEFAEPVVSLHPIDIADEITPLSSIPMPYGTGKLLSDWPPELTKVTYRRTPLIDKAIFNSMKIVQSIGYAPNPGIRLRNQVPYKLYTKKSRNRLTSQDSSKGDKDDQYVVVPKRYQKIEVKYSKMGADEFDYNFYNRSSFSGLESTLPNSYCNAMLQVLYFIDPLRAALLSHICDKEFCLSCELGFFFHMVDISKGVPCQASNFFRAFRTIPEASALGLILPNSDDALKKVNLGPLIQSWNRFILQQIHAETVEQHDDSNDNETSGGKFDSQHQSIASKLFGTEMYNQNKCRCGNEQQQDATTLVFSLVYPDISPPAIGKPYVQYSFADILRRSVCLEQNTQAWCDKCEKYQPTVQSRRVKRLPEILAINCGMDANYDLKFWRIQHELLNPKETKNSTPSRTSPQKPCRYGNACSKKECKFFHDITELKSDEYTTLEDVPTAHIPWMPPGLRIKLNEDGKVDIDNIMDLSKEALEPQMNDSIIYHLITVVSHIKDPRKPDRQNVVSFIKVGPAYHQRTMGGCVTQWYLFNDFIVIPISQEEVLSCEGEWKVPCVLYYGRIDILEKNHIEVVNPITQDVFLEDKSLATQSGYHRITFTPLGIDEMLGEGDIVAMDAEFVSLNQEESELRSDGTRSTIKPSQMAVARITCIRGQGPLKGTPFIDDYISTQEQVVDYLTKFSGIMPGDLDATLSSKHLTTLKSTYIKLRFLIDNGVKFVGHGLKTDFRVINLVVPPEQVIDTVHLFHQSHQRMISLRFLAWHFLGLKIQSVIHDSIEDARTALRLNEKYEDLETGGKVKEALKELYEKGRNLQWKVPGMKD